MKTTQNPSEAKRAVILQSMRQEDINVLQHQLRMGDATILPEDLGRVNQEIVWGASLNSLRKSGLIR